MALKNVQVSFIEYAERTIVSQVRFQTFHEGALPFLFPTSKLKKIESIHQINKPTRMERGVPSPHHFTYTTIFKSAIYILHLKSVFSLY